MKEKLEKPPIVDTVAVLLQETILRKQDMIDLHIIFVLKICGSCVWLTRVWLTQHFLIKCDLGIVPFHFDLAYQRTDVMHP